MRFFQITAKYILMSIPWGSLGLLFLICAKLQGVAQWKRVK